MPQWRAEVFEFSWCGFPTERTAALSRASREPHWLILPGQRPIWFCKPFIQRDEPGTVGIRQITTRNGLW